MKKNGFTLIELLVVIGIVAILSIIAVPSILKLYNNSLENSFKTESLAVLKSLDDDLSIDYNDITEYDCTKDNENTFKKLKYLKKFLNTDSINITTIGKNTTHDSDYKYYKEILIKYLTK